HRLDDRWGGNLRTTLRDPSSNVRNCFYCCDCLVSFFRNDTAYAKGSSGSWWSSIGGIGCTSRTGPLVMLRLWRREIPTTLIDADFGEAEAQTSETPDNDSYTAPLMTQQPGSSNAI